MREHRDMLLLDADGAAAERDAGGTATRCARPISRPSTISKAVTRRIIGEWGFQGLKIDGQDLNGVAPCYNPAHNHARPEESVEKLQDFWKAIYDTAIVDRPEHQHRDLPVRRQLRLLQHPGA